MENEDKGPRENFDKLDKLRVKLRAFDKAFGKEVFRRLFTTLPGWGIIVIATLFLATIVVELWDYIQLNGIEINMLKLGAILLGAIVLRIIFEVYKKKKNDPKVKETLKKVEMSEEGEGVVITSQGMTTKFPRIKAGWSFFIEMIKKSSLLAVIVLGILHGALYVYWPTFYQHLWDTPGFLLLHLFLIALILLGPFIKEGHPVIRGLATLATALVVVGFGFKFWTGRVATTPSTEEVGRITNDMIYPLPDRLPPDTQFVMVAIHESRSPKIIVPVYYGIEINTLGKDQTNCIDVFTQLTDESHPYEICGTRGECQYVEFEDPEVVQVRSRKPSTRLKVRLYDSRVAPSQRAC